ncbi:MAG: 4-hydroxy-3-polyprenylbenzoate decarboxylase [Tenuifilum sp.]|jgi:4-hydroxy-3-polyprenylbenzoate decarboxylase|uniref:menaquinone biosynthesis decarboxylase n=1 Tax=Tenuifilum sp. TaxID=2760880 RepID=UPI0024AB83A7|nr:menaquinone biosynthesis decarboxylase [Tenuifilum sp.]MDI3526093.1 4-hydroxy-3-polyprenylbenzoate decarboxylase [Tenuifilum sp.]
MAYNSLNDFISILEANGELVRIKEFVDPVLEIAEITDRQSKLPGGGKALLFENTGTKFPVLTNAFGSHKRICLALGVEELEMVREKISQLFELLSKPKNSIWDKLEALPQLGQMSSWIPTLKSGKGVCQEVINQNPDLGALPVLKCWPFDGGRFVTLPMVHTKHPETGVRNIGMYRMQILDGTHTGMHWHMHKTGAKHFQEYKRLKKLMPVAVTLGGDPSYTYAATAPVPENIDEYLLAGFLRNKKVKLVKCLTVDLEVPEDVDFVIEGYVDPSEEPVWEGPFGDHTGFYSLADWYPRFTVTCITHKKNAIYPATIVGVPPMEDAYIAKATERIFLEPIRKALLPELDDMVLPAEGVAHNIALVSIKDEFKGQAYRVMNALWGAGQMMFNKILVAFPSSLDLNNGMELLKHIFNVVNPETDIYFGKGPLDVLDHSSNQFAFGSKLFIDATTESKSLNKLEVNVDELVLKLNEISEQIVKSNVSLVKEDVPVAIISVNKKEVGDWKTFKEKLTASDAFNGIKGVVLVDMDDVIDDLSVVLWYVSGNVDPQRDISIVLNGDEDWRIIIDGTKKAYPSDKFPRLWPNIVSMDTKTIELVDKKWESYGIGEFVKSPSLKFQKLIVGSDAVVRYF